LEIISVLIEVAAVIGAAAFLLILAVRLAVQLCNWIAWLIEPNQGRRASARDGEEPRRSER
jgi:lauroyl/myristoyl acyltransferase